MQAIAAVQAGNDIHIQQFVGAFLVILPSERLGIADDTEPFQVDALDEVWSLDV
jgi:hypothetical protein